MRLSDIRLRRKDSEGVPPERSDNLGPERLELPRQERCACHDFRAQRIAILWRPALHCIQDEHIVST
jgi:hypothetical protein